MSETFVLVHGAWHGAWCWTGVMGELERNGHRAYALDLPGRWTSPLPHAQVNRNVWVDAVVKFIEDRDLRNVALAGHSMGGLTISGVALKIPRRVKRVIYVTALVPPDEGSLADEFPRLIGPAIGADRYQVGPDVHEAVTQTFGPAAAGFIRPDPSAPGRWLLDLWAANRHALRQAEVPGSQIHVTGIPTGPDPGHFFSDRTARPCGRLALVARLRPGGAR